MLYKVAVVLFVVEALVVRELGASQIKVVGQNNDLPISGSKDKLFLNNESGSLLKDYLKEIENVLNYLFSANNYNKTGLSIQKEGDNIVFKGLATVINENTNIDLGINIKKIIKLLRQVIKLIKQIIDEFHHLQNQ